MNLRPDHVGDEILSGKRQDKHSAQGHRTAGRAWLGAGLGALMSATIGALITEALRYAFGSGDVVFCCAASAATPDDPDAACAAAALGVPLALHPEAQALITNACATRRPRKALPSTGPLRPTTSIA